MSEELKAAQARIAELEGALLAEQMQAEDLSHELAALKAQEPVAEVSSVSFSGQPITDSDIITVSLPVGTPLYAAPVVSAEQQWVPVSERLPEVPDGDEQEVIVCVKRAHDGKSYCFSARYLNNFPLHDDYDDEPKVVTGWHDVKEHADYDGWYSPLIDRESGDAVTHWMPLPAAPAPSTTEGQGDE